MSFGQNSLQGDDIGITWYFYIGGLLGLVQGVLTMAHVRNLGSHVGKSSGPSSGPFNRDIQDRVKLLWALGMCLFGFAGIRRRWWHFTRFVAE